MNLKYMIIFKVMGIISYVYIKRLIKSFSMVNYMVFVYITCKDKKEARKISMHLIKNKLVACTNSFPIESSYVWKGKIVEETEYVILAKTIKKNYSKVQEEVKKVHSYEVPCICLLESTDNKEYSKWMNGVLG